MRYKVSVIGAGNVGATCALLIAQQELADVALVDVVEGMPQGKALDILQSAGPLGFSTNVEGSNDFSAIADSEVVVVTAGLARKPGMDRLDLLKKNADIISTICQNITKYAPQSLIIMVSNPVDVMTYHAYKQSPLRPHRVFGQAGVLDSARMATFVAMELKCAVKEVSAMVLGGHGDSMVPLPRYTTVGGVPITDLIPADRIAAIAERTRQGGGEIVNLLKTGSAYYAPAAATVKMVAAVLQDSQAILPVSAYLTGQYGIQDLYVGVPAKIGKDGVEEVLELPLRPEELAALQNSATIYKRSIAELYNTPWGS